MLPGPAYTDTMSKSHSNAKKRGDANGKGKDKIREQERAGKENAQLDLEWTLVRKGTRQGRTGQGKEGIITSRDRQHTHPSMLPIAHGRKSE